ncbi:zinc finger protein 616-like [Anopheles aquasalis]|uniref:zinc finger protein 616-like n=1 Tax=Anopheles aquasalis TaxID=42839 RepID=UPI00215B2089|nr:zinc finger protein 616-like [Anopheles aquasalis]
MPTVCEVCYCSSAEQTYLDILGEEQSGRNVVMLLSLHLQFVQLDAIDRPQICIGCWNSLESFHQFYCTIEDLHRPATDSESESEASNGPDTVSCEQIRNQRLEITNRTLLELEAEAEKGTDGDGAKTYRVDVLSERGSSCNEEEPQDSDADDDEVVNEYQSDTATNDQELIEFYGPLMCKSCDSEQCSTLDDLKRHTLAVHGKTRISLQCPVCLKTLRFRSKLLQHIDMHRNPEQYRCTICAEVHQELEAHINDRHRWKQYACKTCAKSFCSLHRLLRHKLIAHAPKNVACTICQRMYTKYSFKYHMRTVHGKLELVCEHCGKVYRTIGLLNKHKALHEKTKSPAKMTNCTVCRQTIRQSYLNRHMEVMHSDSPPVTCSVCGNSFRNKRSLSHHRTRCCTGNVFRCAVCSRNFKTLAKLNEHRVTHVERARCMCPICLSKFDTLSLLLAHQKLVHRSLNSK